MVSEDIQIILRYPSGYREQCSGVFDGDVLYRVMFPLLKIKKEAFEIDYDHVGYQKSGLGSFLNLPIYKKVVDVDFNANSTAGMLNRVEMIEVEDKDSDGNPILDGDGNVKMKKVKGVSGKTVATNCRLYPDARKKVFYEGYALKKLIEGEKKGFDLMTFVAGGFAFFTIYKLAQTLLATQGIII